MKNLTKFLVSAGIVLGLSEAVRADVSVAPPPSDQQIAHTLLTINKAEVDAGQLAQRISRNPQVLDFAKAIVADHSSMNVEATALFARIRLVPQDNETSRGLQKSSDDMFAKLQALKGAEFDKAFIAHMAHGHQQVLTTIDQAFIPNVKNPEFKALLIKGRGVVVSHIERLGKIQIP